MESKKRYNKLVNISQKKKNKKSRHRYSGQTSGFQWGGAEWDGGAGGVIKAQGRRAVNSMWVLFPIITPLHGNDLYFVLSFT